MDAFFLTRMTAGASTGRPTLFTCISSNKFEREKTTISMFSIYIVVRKELQIKINLVKMSKSNEWEPKQNETK